MTGIAISGGFLRTPQVLQPDLIEGQQFVKVTKTEGWLCLAASGKGRQLKPLLRTSVLETLGQMIETMRNHGHGQSPADGMLKLGLDDDLPVEGSAFLQVQRPGRKARSSRQRAPLRKPEVFTLQLPSALARGDKQEVRMLSASPKGYTAKAEWIHVEDLPWLIQVLADEVRDGGVGFVPSPSQIRKPYFSQRDLSWVCRAKTPGGDVIRKRIAVPMFSLRGSPSKHDRMPLSQQEFGELKAAKLQEITEWQEGVELGLFSV